MHVESYILRKSTVFLFKHTHDRYKIDNLVYQTNDDNLKKRERKKNAGY